MSAVRVSPFLTLSDLSVAFPTATGRVLAANCISLEIYPGQALGLVGESGSGKSVTLRALCGLVPAPGQVVGGTLAVDGRNVAWGREQRALRGRTISMVFQDATASLTPVRSVGAQLREVLRETTGLSRAAARTEAIALLDRVGISSARKRLAAYPHELSGGMRQRVMLALAIATRPRLLLADEPTTSLDVTTQERILALIKDLQAETGMAMIFVTHDVAVVEDICDDVMVLYAGYVVERGKVSDVTKQPRHPYTRGLVSAVPRLYTPGPLAAIPGQPPDMAALPPGCPFAPRCQWARPECLAVNMRREAATQDCACPFARTGAVPEAPLAVEAMTE